MANKQKQVKPLTSKTFTVDSLTEHAIAFAERVRSHLHADEWNDGYMTDMEFCDVVGEFIVELQNDADMRKIIESGDVPEHS